MISNISFCAIKPDIYRKTNKPSETFDDTKLFSAEDNLKQQDRFEYSAPSKRSIFSYWRGVINPDTAKDLALYSTNRYFVSQPNQTNPISPQAKTAIKIGEDIMNKEFSGDEFFSFAQENLKKYFPEDFKIEVKDISDIIGFDASTSLKNVEARVYTTHRPTDCLVDSSEIYMRKPSEYNFQKAKEVSTLVHEVTHIMQKTQDENYLELVQRLVAKKAFTSIATKAGVLLQSIIDTSLNAFNKNTIYVSNHTKQQYLKNRISFNKEFEINKKAVFSCIDSAVVEAREKTGLPSKELRKDFLDAFRMEIKFEIDAHQAELEFLREFIPCDIHKEFDARLLIDIYKYMLRLTDEYAKKYKISVSNG